MKALIVVAAAALAFPVYAQQKQDTTLPNAQERAQNRDKVETQADKAKERCRPRKSARRTARP